MYPPIVLVALLLLFACEEQPELAGGTSLITEVMVFPTHDEPLPTDWGLGHLAGELVIWNGCLHVNAEPTPISQADSQLPYMLVWPGGFTLIEQSIHNREGVVVASVGDNLRVSVRGVSRKSDLGKRIRQGIPENCAARSYFIVGDDVSVIGKDEPVFLSVPGSPVKFQRQQTVSTSRGNRALDTADDYRNRGELVLERDCLLIRHPEGIHPEEKYAIVWPAGFHPYVDEDGQIEVRNGGGRTVARVGDWLRLRGGESTVGDMSKCNMTLFYVEQLLNLTLPQVFPQHDTDKQYARIKGHLESRNGCFIIQEQTLIWPTDWAVTGVEGSLRVIDGNGNIVAMQGEEVELAGRPVGLEDDLSWSARRVVPVDCHTRNLYIVGA